jgi:hypothetical protein
MLMLVWSDVISHVYRKGQNGNLGCLSRPVIFSSLSLTPAARNDG